MQERKKATEWLNGRLFHYSKLLPGRIRIAGAQDSWTSSIPRVEQGLRNPEEPEYISHMRKKEYKWEVIGLRARGEYLGKVKAPAEEAAIKAAIKAFEVVDVE